ncbi:hypothetical protein MBLNU457_7421t1 [Dothideomycetes sp. NU457]
MITGPRGLRVYICYALTLIGICTTFLLLPREYHPVLSTERVSNIHHWDLQTFTSHAVNNTVVVVPVNAGMLHWADNLICSLKQTSFNASNIVFWCLDESAQDQLSQRGFATYRDTTLFSVSRDENLRGTTKDYDRMMKERPKFYIDLLRTGLDMMMLDVDTIWYQSPLEIVPSGSEHAHVDVVYSTDARNFYQTKNAFRDFNRRGPYIPPVCNGVFWMKSSPRTISIWTEMQAVFEARWWQKPIWTHFLFQDDQRGMDVILNDGRARLVEPFPGGITSEMVKGRYKDTADLNVRLLDQTQVINGQLLKTQQFRYKTNLAELRSMGKDRIAAHFNWSTKDKGPKDAGAKELGMFYLDDQGACILT